MSQVQVIGGGFSGLATAYFLARSGKKVRLVEKSGRYGGLVRTLQSPYGLVETAANAVLSNRLVEETASDLGIRLVAALPSSRARYIFRGGKMRRWPLSLGGSISIAAAASRFLLARHTLAPHRFESILDWGNRALGRDATDYLLVPGLTGIFAGDPSQLSASLILGKLFGPRPAAGKLRGSVAPVAGMEEWSRGFIGYLRENGAEFSSQAEECLPTVVALPPHQAREFLAPRAPRLAALLESIEVLPLVSVTCFFAGNSGINGFGCLFPRSEGFRVLGVLANDRIFPGRSSGARSETWIFGGATDREIIDLPDDDLLLLIQNERERLLGQKESLLHFEITRWHKAVPYYTIGLERSLESLAPFEEGPYRLFGTYLGDLGLGRVLIRAEELARSFN